LFLNQVMIVLFILSLEDILGLWIIRISKLENKFSTFENNLLKYVVL
jgi:hypothetical protein